MTTSRPSIRRPGAASRPTCPSSRRSSGGTIADNIRLGAPAATSEDVRAGRGARSRRCLRPHASRWVRHRGRRRRTCPLGRREGGRVALARAFLRDAPLVLLDEPTADLDPESASIVADAVETLREDRTLVLVAHRPELAGRADRIVRAPARASGIPRGPARDVRPVVLPRDRGRGVERARRWLADLRQRPLRKDENWFVHETMAGGGYERWPVSRADLDPHYDRVEKMIGPAALPVRPRPYQHAEDDRLQGRRPRPRQRVVPAQAGRHLRQRGTRRRCPASRSSRSAQPPRPDPHHLPAVRRVRHRLQLRRQEHARLQLPLRRPPTTAPRIRTLCEVRRFEPARAAATGSTTSRTTPTGTAPPTAARAR